MAADLASEVHTLACAADRDHCEASVWSGAAFSERNVPGSIPDLESTISDFAHRRPCICEKAAFAC